MKTVKFVRKHLISQGYIKNSTASKLIKINDILPNKNFITFLKSLLHILIIIISRHKRIFIQQEQFVINKFFPIKDLVVLKDWSIQNWRI